MGLGTDGRAISQITHRQLKIVSFCKKRMFVRELSVTSTKITAGTTHTT
jgi:hypothetical protein